MLPELTLVLGGAASGKSAFAEGLATGSGQHRIYLATAEVRDDEMRKKVSKHKEMRGEGWTTIEAPLTVAPALNTATPGDIVLLDCATMWLSNHLLADHDLDAAQRELLAALRASAASVIVVSNEVGMSVVPDNKLARTFQNAQGALNQALAAQAGLVVKVIAGLPLVLKGALP